jgi:pantoate kinase
MTDVYRDTDERYQRDPAFHAAVRTMEAIAREHGFTPGELKQIAFKAALNLEERQRFVSGERTVFVLRRARVAALVVHGCQRACAGGKYEPSEEVEET